MPDSPPPERELDPALPMVVEPVSTSIARINADTNKKFASKGGGLQYDSELADASVRARNLFTDKRFWQMAKTLGGFSIEAFSHRIKPKYSKSELKRRRAIRLRDALVELGPTFIKLGQFLSVRRDCLPLEIADELTALQDKVPPFSFDLVRSTIESDLGALPEQVFAYFDEKPIASASIGQVHRATLKDGQTVVVKVQRPDLAQLFYQDLGYMRLLARMGLLLRPQAGWDSWLALSDEFGKNLFNEINYIQEGRNADRIRHVLRNHDSLVVPRVYWKFTGRRVLTLEYLPGTKIDKVQELERKGVNLSKIANDLVNGYLEQVLMHGFFHADPHAGNLSITDEGKIIIYDFGMMGEISEIQREAITGCIAAVIKRDVPDLIRNLTMLGIVREDAQIGPVTRALEPFLDYYSGKELRDLNFSAIEQDIDSIATDKALNMPPHLAYVLRAGTTLEGIARTLRPNFSFVEASKPALKKWILSRPANAATLLKVIFNITDDKLLKLTQGKNKNGSKTDTEEVKFAAANLQEVNDLKSKVFLLETQIKEQGRKSSQLVSLCVWLMLFPLIISTFANIPEYRSYTNYFLIGNAVIGAIIMWHLVAPESLARRTKKSGQSRGQRR